MICFRKKLSTEIFLTFGFFSVYNLIVVSKINMSNKNNPMLTKRKKQIFDYIKRFIKKHDYSPSIPEVAKHFELAISTVHQHIEELKRDGYLNKLDNRSRTIEISKPKKRSSELIKIPLAGVITAGQPVETYESNEKITIPKSYLSGSGKHFALKVDGNSMIDEGIFDDSIVIVKKQDTAQNGDTVVALINSSETTLKKFYRDGNKIKLQPRNPKMKPISVNSKNLLIQGKVINIYEDVRAENNKVKTEKVKRSKCQKRNKTTLKKYLNKVFNEDIMSLLKKLPDKSVDMVFGDPDYNVGIKYQDKTYTKTFDEYINWYGELTKESLRVLKPNGNLFMINYPKQNAHLRVKYLDKFYPLIGEYAWVYNTNVGHTPKRFTTAHRTILHVRKSKNNKFYKNNVAVPYKNPKDKRILKNLKNGSKGRMPYSWFYFNLVKNVSKEKTYHACQIPQKLTETLIKSSTMPNDIALILFGGSGSELEVCKNLKRKYISAEIDKKYYKMIQDRLKNGYIKKEYKLKLANNKNKDTSASLPLFNKEG